jgi:hypothetical protein
MPFRFYVAHRELMDRPELAPASRPILKAISDALELSAANVPELPADALALIDVSRSMAGAKLSVRSTVSVAEVASVMGAIVAKRSGMAGHFATMSRFFPVDPSLPVMALAKQLYKANVGEWTKLGGAIERMGVDRIKTSLLIVLSDMQTADDARVAWLAYRRDVSPGAHLVTIDMCHYGNAVFLPEDCIQLAGWSDRILEFVAATHADMVTTISAITI